VDGSERYIVVEVLRELEPRAGTTSGLDVRLFGVILGTSVQEGFVFCSSFAAAAYEVELGFSAGAGGEVRHGAISL
jgi:hypothetical protein